MNTKTSDSMINAVENNIQAFKDAVTQLKTHDYNAHKKVLEVMAQLSKLNSHVMSMLIILDK